LRPRRGEGRTGRGRTLPVVRPIFGREGPGGGPDGVGIVSSRWPRERSAVSKRRRPRAEDGGSPSGRADPARDQRRRRDRRAHGAAEEPGRHGRGRGGRPAAAAKWSAYPSRSWEFGG